MTDAIRELFELLTKKEKSGSDYTGTVTRVDGKTAYVQFDGSDITDTPVALSIGAKAGDSVRVRVADGRAWLVGNDDAPPNDSSEVGYELALTNALIRQLTTEQINGENGWINLLLGTFNYGNKLIWNGRELTLNGKVVTTSGTIGGWNIGADRIYSTNSSGNYVVLANGSNANQDVLVVRTGAGTAADPYVWPFYVRADGTLSATKGKIGPWTLSSSGLSTTFFQLTENGVSEGTLLSFINKQDTTIKTEMYAGMFSLQSNTASGVQFLSCSVIKDSGVKAGLITLGNDSNYAVVNISGLDGSLYCSGAVYENGTALSNKYAPINLNYVKDVYNGNNTTFAYGMSGLNYSDYTWLAGWNGYQLRAVNKSQFLASTGGTLSGSLVVSGGLTVTGGSIHASGYNVVASNTDDVFNYAQNNTSKCYIACRSEPTGTHGIFSNGYYNGSSHTASGQYLIYRSTSNNTIIPTKLYTHNEGYTTNRPVVGTNEGTNAVGVIVSSASSFGIYGRWAGGATAAMSGRTISCPSSDIRLKENIKDSTVDALSVINAIKIRQFDWKDKSRGHWDCGMVVDEMEKDVDPRMCIGGGEDEDGNISYKSVDTFYLQGYEVKAIQELHAEVRSLKAEIAELKEIIAVLMEGKK